jgi:hypothetical protein
MPIMPLRALLRTVPLHHDHAGIVRTALADAEQRIHPELLHRRHVEDLDLDAELLQLQRALGRFVRVQNIRRLVDKVAGDEDALVDRVRIRPQFA